MKGLIRIIGLTNESAIPQSAFSIQPGCLRADSWIAECSTLMRILTHYSFSYSLFLIPCFRPPSSLFLPARYCSPRFSTARECGAGRAADLLAQYLKRTGCADDW